MFHPRLGLFRFLLSLSVLSFHVWPAVFPQSGPIAVVLFFFISGYLISTLLDGPYRGRPRDFVVNRILRIYPAYYAAACIGLLTVVLLPELSRNANSAFRLDSSVSEILTTVTIFGLHGMRLVPPAWSLDTELRWYAILFVLAFFSNPVRLCVFAVFLVLPWLFAAAGEPSYGSVLGSGFAFALGAMRYQSRSLMARTPAWLEWSCLLATVGLMFLAPFASNTTGSDGPLVLVAPYLFFISFGAVTGGGNEPRNLRRLAYYGGLYSYPIFLVHWPASILALYLGLAGNTAGFWAATLAFTSILATLVVFAVELPLRGVRSGIRGKTLANGCRPKMAERAGAPI